MTDAFSSNPLVADVVLVTHFTTRTWNREYLLVFVLGVGAHPANARPSNPLVADIVLVTHFTEGARHRKWPRHR